MKALLHCLLVLVIAACATQTGEGAPNFPKTRDPLRWPFSSNSIWNTPLGSQAKLVPAGLEAPPYWGMFLAEDIVIMTPSAPLADVYENFVDWNESAPGARCAKQGKLMARLPMPVSFVYAHTDEPVDASAAILMPDGRSVYQTQPFHRCVAAGHATSHYVFDTVDLYGDGRLGAHGGSGLSSLGGTIRIGELVSGGVIRHALKIYVWSNKYLHYGPGPTPGFRWPASKGAGSAAYYGGKNTAMVMGSLLVLPPSFVLSKLKTEPARIVAAALQHYGAYVVDNASSENIALTVERGPNGLVSEEFKKTWGYDLQSPRQTTPFAQDLALLWPALQVVDNNTANNVGGGGTPRQPKAPELIAP